MSDFIVYRLYLAELNMSSYCSHYMRIRAECENDVSEDIDQNSEDGSGDYIADHCEIGNSGNESDDDGEHHFASNSYFSELQVEEAFTLSQELAAWATRNTLTRKSVNEILGILNRNGHCLPKDQRTLLSTPKSFSVTPKRGGQYIYFGIENRLCKVIVQNSVCVNDSIISLLVNID